MKNGQNSLKLAIGQPLGLLGLITSFPMMLTSPLPDIVRPAGPSKTGPLSEKMFIKVKTRNLHQKII